MYFFPEVIIIKTVEIFTDGACSGNPGAGGYGVVMRYGTYEKELSGGDSDTTNNRMELTGVIVGLSALKKPCKVILTTDSKYVVDSITKGWVYNWQKNNWIKSDKKPALNADLWKQLLPLLEMHDVTFNWVKGHAGHPENERCDSLAVAQRDIYYKGEIIMEKRFIYADNAATTAVSEEVLNAMLPHFTKAYGNASSIYKLGRDAQRDIENAREKVAKAIGADPKEIFFTSCGSEADNWAIKGIAENMTKKGKKHIITSVFEHHAVLHTCQYLEKHGYEVTYVPVSADGFVNPEDIKNAIREDTGLVTIMYANNEIGTIQPIEEIAKICKEKKVIFHTDAVQAVGHVEIDVKKQGIDMLSLSGHKIHAQKGIGALYVRKGITLPNLIHGGAQERNKRAGTENVPAIVGLGVAIENATRDIAGKNSIITPRRNRLIDGILQLPYTRLNGDRDKRLAGNLNISIEGIEGESLLLMLDLNGICASSGSACTSGSLDPSHVLLSIGLKHEVAHGSLRLSIEEDVTDEDVDYILEVVPKVVERLRSMSPVWEKMMKGESYE